MHIGLFFGSFNPIHIGHLILADTMAELPDISQVWFVVSPHNPLKSKSSLLHEQDRFDMVRIAIADNPKLNVTDIEFRLPKPSYTIDTLAYLQEKYPQHSFKLIIGEDNLTHFHKWKNHEKILEYYDLLVFPRPDTPQTRFHNHPKVKIIDTIVIDISATFIRERIRKGESIKYIVPHDVEKFIHLKGFYKEG